MSAEFTPANELERLLMDAADNPAVRPEFYRLLMESTIFVLTPPEEGEGVRTFRKGESVQFVSWSNDERKGIALFTSLERARESLDRTGGNWSYLAFPAKDLFEMLAEGDLPAILNPDCAYGKVLTQDEMADIASGTILESAPTEVLEEDRQVMIGEPSKYPHDLVRALQDLFTRTPAVQAGYLAQYFDAASDESPHLLIALKMDEEKIDQISQDAAMVTRDVFEGNVDFISLDETDDIGDYFLTQTKPFYEIGGGRSFLGRLFGK